MRLFILLLALGLAGSLFIPASATAWANSGDGDIQVLEQGAESQFPEGIRFFLTVRSPNEIDDIRVFFKIIGRAAGSAYRVVEFEPGQTVTAETLLSSGSGNSYMPPGTTIEYSFEVQDAAGQVHRTPDETFIYDDVRFEWETVSAGLITVYYYGDYGEEQARAILDAAAQALERMTPVLGIEPTEPLRIVTYSDYRDMAAALPFRSQTVSEQLLTQGMAFNDERVLLVYGSGPGVKGTASHEFTHLLVAEAAGRARSFVPAWLNEGLAEFGNIDPSDSYDAALDHAILTRRVKPLWHLTTFGGTPNDIIIAYGQGRSVVRYLIDTYGAGKIAELFRALQQTRNLDPALEQVYGFDQHGLDSEWRLSLGLEPLPPPERLEPQLQATRTLPPAPTPTPSPAPTSAPEPTQAASSPEEGGPQVAPGGCSAPGPVHAGEVAADLASLAMLGGLGAMLWSRLFRRRRASAGAGVESVRDCVPQQVEGEQ